MARQAQASSYWLTLRWRVSIEPATVTWALLQLLRNAGQEMTPQYRSFMGYGQEPLRLNRLEDVECMFEDPRSRPEIEGKPGYTVISFWSEDKHLMISLEFNRAGEIEMIIPPACMCNLPYAAIRQLFVGCITVFRPYWGAIQNGDNVDRFYGTSKGGPRFDPDELARSHPIVKVDETLIPRLIHWFNYFGAEFVERLGGREKLLAAPVGHCEEIADLGGILWVLQEDPFDDANRRHRMCQQAAMAYLGLSDLHKDFMLK